MLDRPHSVSPETELHTTQPVAAAQRAVGEAGLSSKRVNGLSRIDRLRQQGCCKIRLPDRANKPANGSLSVAPPLEAVMINSSGGLTAGDTLDWNFETAPNTAVTVTTQAAERAYKASAGSAKVSVAMTLGESSQLAWLPQETILFDGSALERTVSIRMAKAARLLMVEPVVFGREAMGESLSRVHFRDRWTIHRDEANVHTEALAISKGHEEPTSPEPLTSRYGLSGHLAMATVLLIEDDAETRLDGLRGLLNASSISDFCAASGWNGKILARLVSPDAYTLRKTLIPVLELLNDGATMPKAWSL